MKYLRDFIKRYNLINTHKRKETERFKTSYDKLLKRDKINLIFSHLEIKVLKTLIIFLHPPNIIAQEIVENLETALGEFSLIEENLSGK